MTEKQGLLPLFSQQSVDVMLKDGEHSLENLEAEQSAEFSELVSKEIVDDLVLKVTEMIGNETCSY